MNSGSTTSRPNAVIAPAATPDASPANVARGFSVRDAESSDSMLHLVVRRFRRHQLATVSLGVLIVLTTISFGVPLFVSADAANDLTVTAMQQAPSLAHPFGTDDVGRDILMRCIFGGRISLQVGFLAALISVTIGMIIGGVAGFNQRWVDSILMRFTDALLSIPSLFVLILVTQIVGKSVAVITVVIGALSWMIVSRIVRANVLSLKEQDFVVAAQSIGARPQELLIRHLLPNTFAPIVVSATLGVGQAIIMEASLSFLGLGVQQPTATWGNMLFRAQSYLVTAPWIAIFPGSLIFITVLCVNFVGDGLRDALDPYARR